MAFLQNCFGGCGSTHEKHPYTTTTIEDLCHRFSLSQLRKSTNNFDKSLIIRRENFSVIYGARISINGQLKYLALQRLNQEEVASRISWYKNNIIYRCQLQHPNLESLVGYCDDENEFIIVHDCAPNGSLGYQLYGIDGNSPTLSWKRRLEISIGVARGLHYLHSGTKRTIIHRDIKPASILLDKNWVPKLKFSEISVKGPKFSEKGARPIELEHASGTAGFIAPEHLNNKELTHKCDVYSFGALLLSLICEDYARHDFNWYQACNCKELLNSVEAGNGEGVIDESWVGEIAPQCWKLYKEITEFCLNEDPNERPDMGEVEVQLEHVLQLQEEVDTNHASLI